MAEPTQNSIPTFKQDLHDVRHEKESFFYGRILYGRANGLKAETFTQEKVLFMDGYYMAEQMA